VEDWVRDMYMKRQANAARRKARREAIDNLLKKG
jgi:hypothetical protein